MNRQRALQFFFLLNKAFMKPKNRIAVKAAMVLTAEDDESGLDRTHVWDMTQGIVFW